MIIIIAFYTGILQNANFSFPHNIDFIVALYGKKIDGSKLF